MLTAILVRGASVDLRSFSSLRSATIALVKSLGMFENKPSVASVFQYLRCTSCQDERFWSAIAVHACGGIF